MKHTEPRVIPASKRPAAIQKAKLYERDYYSWALDQARALRKQRIKDLDWKNLAEGVEDLAKGERRALRSQSARLIEHLLKLAFASRAVLEANRRVWQLTLSNREEKYAPFSARARA